MQPSPNLLLLLARQGLAVHEVRDPFGRGITYPGVFVVLGPEGDRELGRFRLVTEEEPNFSVGFHVLALPCPIPPGEAEDWFLGQKGRQYLGWSGGHYLYRVSAPLGEAGEILVSHTFRAALKKSDGDANIPPPNAV